MKTRRMVGIAVALVAVCLAGCAVESRKPMYKGSTFQMIIAAETRTVTAGREMTEKDVQEEVDRLLALKPAAPVPAKVLLFEVESTGQSKIVSPKKMLSLRKETSESMKAALEKTGLFERIDFLPDVYLPPNGPADLKVLRIAAARAHADGLLIYSTEAGFEKRVNFLGIFYPTIIGAFIMPGTRGSSLAESKAVLVDVRTGYVYRVLNTYGEASALAPGALLDEEQLEFDARKQALGALADLAAAEVRELGAGVE